MSIDARRADVVSLASRVEFIVLQKILESLGRLVDRRSTSPFENRVVQHDGEKDEKESRSLYSRAHVMKNVGSNNNYTRFIRFLVLRARR